MQHARSIQSRCGHLGLNLNINPGMENMSRKMIKYYLWSKGLINILCGDFVGSALVHLKQEPPPLSPQTSIMSRQVYENSEDPERVKNETAQLNYIKWEDKFETEKPYEVLSEVPAGFPRSNFSCSPAAPEAIEDIRGREELFNLQDHGFQIWRHHHTMETFDKESIEHNYLPSLDSLLKEVFGSETETYFFDWRV